MKTIFIFAALCLMACSAEPRTQATPAVTVFPSPSPTPLATQITEMSKPEVAPTDANYPVLQATLSGYFTKLEKEGFQNQKALCDSLVVVSGDSRLIQAWLSLIVEQGNTMNAKNELNQPIISIKLDELSVLDRQKITTSTEAQQVTLVVESLPARPMGGELCYSPVRLLKVN